MILRRDKRILCAILAILVLFLVSCKKTEVEKVKIKGMSVDAYLETVKSMVETIYAPRSEDDFKNVRSIFREYASKEVYDIFTSVSEDFEYETFDSKVEWEDVMFGLDGYQLDGNHRVYLEFNVVRNYIKYPIKLEFIINDEGIMIDYRVY